MQESQLSPSPKPEPLGMLRAYHIGAMVRLLGCLVIMAGMIWVMADEVIDYRTRVRGQESGLGDGPPQLPRRFAANVSLEGCADLGEMRVDLEAAQALGVGAVRQRLSWARIEPYPGVYDWTFCDAFFPIAQELELDVIAVLDQAPDWARAEWEQDNLWAPPMDLGAYSRFALVLAQRYGGQIHAYQIWDKPNIAPHWGSGAIDPAGYVKMLALASTAIRQADPDAILITGALGQTTESGGRNMSDVRFLQECYRRDAGRYFDVVGVQALGFWSGPQDRRVDESILNLSRVILLREEMLRRGEGEKPIWALETGWCALPEDWQGRPSPAGSDSAFVQAERTVGAYERIQQEWPWMTLICTPSIRPHAADDDPVWGYALNGPDGQATRLGQRLARYIQANRTLYPGFHAEPENLWKTNISRHRVELVVWGTEIAIRLANEPAAGELDLVIPGQPDICLDLTSPTVKGSMVTVAKHMVGGARQIAIYGNAQQLASIDSLSVGSFPERTDLVLMLLSGILALLLVADQASGTSRLIPWADIWYAARVSYHNHLSGFTQTLMTLAGACLAICAPSLSMKLAGLLFMATTSITNPRLYLLWVVSIVPFAPLQVRLGGWSLSLLEISLWFAIAGQSMNLALSHDPIRRLAALWRDICWLDWAVLALVALGLLAASMSEYRHVALREWRTVILGSAALYALVRIAAPDGRTMLAMINMAILGGVLVAAYALVRYPLAEGVIEAEGVRRARAFYGSPNNLALCLERYLPLVVAMALDRSSGARRWAYGLGAAIVGVALVLTFSRASLLIAVPVGLVVIILGKEGRERWWLFAIAAIVLALIMPLAGTERFASLLDISQGTTAVRLSLWRSSWGMALDHPWMGIGPDNFLYYYGDYVLPAGLQEPNLSHPHNLLLDFWLRLGLGGVALLILILTGFSEAWRRARGSALDAEHQAVLLGLLGSTMAGLAHGLVDAWFFVVELAFIFMLTLGWVVASARATRDAADEAVPTR